VFDPRFRLFIPLLVFAWAVATVSQSNGAPVVAPDASVPVSEDYVLRTWGVDEGLPSNRVTSLTQTPDGYLWVATLGGLARFDGVKFTTFNLEKRAQSVFPARDGNLWVGMDGGAVARKVNGRFQMITPGAERDGPVISFAQDASGAVWFGYETPTKVVRWLDGQLTSYTEKDGILGGSHQHEVCSTVNGTIWYANTAGCGSFDGKRFQSIDSAGGGFVHLARTGDGGMWAKRGDRLVRYRPDGSSEIKADVSALSVHVMMEDSSGNLWLGTNNAGLIRLRDGHWEKVPVEGSAVSALFEDREQNLWAGLRSGGVIRLHPRRFYLRQIKDGLSDNDTSSVCADHEGRLWLAGRDHMLVRATDATNRSFSQPEGLRDWVRGTIAVHANPSGGVWLGTSTGLLRYSDEGSFIRESLRGPVTALLADRTGALWAATIKGPLVRHQAGQDLRMPEAGGLTKVLALAEDSAGRIWAGTAEGLVFEKSGEQFVPVPLPGAKSGNLIQFIVPDGPNTVWIGARGGGLYRWREGRVDQLPSGAGLPTDDLRSLHIATEVDFWVGTPRGLLRVARDEIEAVMDGRLPSLHGIAYGRDDGLPSIEFSQGFRGATTQTPDGHLWFATTQGALEITPEEKFSRIAAPLPVLIETVRLGERAMDFDRNWELSIPPRSGPLEIRYTLAQLSASEHLRFRYRLSGLGSGEWVDADRQRTALFTYLPPGDYRFEVAAAGPDGLWLPTTASLVLTVRAAWWETDWFRLSVGLLGALALAALVKFVVKRRMRARIRRLEQKHALERERTRIARDMHDELGASLTRIALMSDLAAVDAQLPPENGRQLGAIAAAARTVSGTLDEIVWMVNPRNDTLERLVGYLAESAGEFLASTDIGLTLDLPEQVPAYVVPSVVRHHLVLVAREALNNVVKHAGARTVRLGITIGNEALTVVIADDGCGFNSDTVAPSSNGLINSRQRLASVDGSYQIESRPGGGTHVTLTLPLPGLP
jgi:signal transduction histidine kinase/ligand-binding sensor domain-containing protein